MGRGEAARDERLAWRDERRLAGIYAAVAAVAVVIGVVGALSTADDIFRRSGVYDLRTPLLWDMTSIAVIMVLTPVLLAAVRRIRRQPSLAVMIGLAIAAIVVFSAVHITGMVWLRKLIMWLAGGAYDFRFSLATVLYEFRKDVTTCVLIGGGLWLIDSRREAQRALKVVVPPAAGRTGQSTAPAAVWLRDGAKSIRIAPRDIVWIASAGNYVEYQPRRRLLAPDPRHARRRRERAFALQPRPHPPHPARQSRPRHRHGEQAVRRFRADLRYRADRFRAAGAITTRWQRWSAATAPFRIALRADAKTTPELDRHFRSLRTDLKPDC